MIKQIRIKLFSLICEANNYTDRCLLCGNEFSKDPNTVLHQHSTAE